MASSSLQNPQPLIYHAGLVHISRTCNFNHLRSKYSIATIYGALRINLKLHCSRPSARTSMILSEVQENANQRPYCVNIIGKRGILSTTISHRLQITSTSYTSTKLDVSNNVSATVASGFVLATLATVLSSLALCTTSDVIARQYCCSCAAGAAASSARPVTEVEALKRMAVNAWTIVNDTYVDGTFNHQNWNRTLQKTLDAMSTADSEDEAYTKLQAMLATLEDPYTRIMPPKDFENFQISKDGSVEGVGLLLGSDQRSGRLYVLSPIKGGPAARAGILSGDELVQIDGEAIKGMDGEEAASRLRGRVGTTVTLGIHRQELSINEAESVRPRRRPAAPEIKIQLLREKIVLSPVSWTILPHTLPDGHTSTTGYIHLASFSESAADEMEKVIREMEQKDVSSYILDLRDNPGGLVRAGLEVAEIWLHSNEIVVNTVDRDGNKEIIRLAADSHPVTDDPLVVLMNGNSASASEIVAGALHDNGRALLLGQRSFGKGKIQSVNELKDGSGLFVTIAKYLSPSLHDIDGKGITPDMECSAAAAAAILDVQDMNVQQPAAAAGIYLDQEHDDSRSKLRLEYNRPSGADAVNPDQLIRQLAQQQEDQENETRRRAVPVNRATSSSTSINVVVVGKDHCVLAAQQQLGAVQLMSNDVHYYD